MYHPLVQMKILVPTSQDRSILSLKPNAPLTPSFKVAQDLITVHPNTYAVCFYFPAVFDFPLLGDLFFKPRLAFCNTTSPHSPAPLVTLCSTICFMFSLHCVHEAFPKILSLLSTFPYYLYLRGIHSFLPLQFLTKS